MTTSAQPHTDTQDGTEHPEPERRRRAARSLTRAVIAIVSTLLAAAVLVIVVVGLGVRADAEDGRIELARGRRALISGDLDEARRRFQTAEERFGRARSRAIEGVGGLVADIPHSPRHSSASNSASTRR